MKGFVCVYILLEVFLLGGSVIESLEDTLSLKGKYALEVEDPFHRHIAILEPAYAIWQEDTKENSFWEFLEVNQEALYPLFPNLYDPKYHMEWLDEETQATYLATWVNDEEGNLLLFNNEKRVLEGKWMYVYCKEHLYIGQEKLFLFHHSSLSGGAPVAAAGMISIKEGKVKAVSLVSGHYRPTVAQGQAFFEHLLEQGVLFPRDLLVTFFAGGETRLDKCSMTVNAFLSYVPDQIIKKELVPLQEFTSFFATKARDTLLYFTADQRVFVASEGEDLSLFNHTTIVATAGIKWEKGKIHKIKFNVIANPSLDREKIREFLLILDKIILDKSVLKIIIKDHEKSKFYLVDFINHM